MKPLPQENVQSAAQVLLAFLDSDGASVPGNMVEGVVSGKSLLRGLLAGQLVICQADVPAEAPPAPTPEPKPAAKKKAASKKKAT